MILRDIAKDFAACSEPDVLTLRELLDNIERCLYGECNDTCPLHPCDDCKRELLSSAEYYLKGHGGNALAKMNEKINYK